MADKPYAPRDWKEAEAMREAMRKEGAWDFRQIGRTEDLNQHKSVHDKPLHEIRPRATWKNEKGGATTRVNDPGFAPARGRDNFNRGELGEASETEYLADAFSGLQDAGLRDGAGISGGGVLELLRRVGTIENRRSDAFYARGNETPFDTVGMDIKRIAQVLECDADEARSAEPVLQMLRTHYSHTLGASIAPLVETDDKSLPSLTHAFSRFLASQEAILLVKRGPRGLVQAMRKHGIDSTTQRLAPVLAWLGAPEMGEAVRSEAMAWMALYVDSGWASRDLGDEPSADADVLGLRKIQSDMLAGKEVPIGHLTATLQARFDKIFVRARVVNEHGNLTLSDSASGGFGISHDGSITIGGRAAGAGVVDVLVRCADDESRLMMACVTAKSDTRSQRDQIMRHAQAVKNACRNGHPPLRTGDKLVSTQVFSMAMVPDIAATPKRTDSFGERLRNAAKASGVEWDEQADNEFCNLVPLFSMLGADVDSQSIDPGTVLHTRHRRFGAGNAPFSPDVTDGELAVEAARFLDHGLRRIACIMSYVRLGSPRSTRSINTDESGFFEMLGEAVRGLVEHYANQASDDPQEGGEANTTQRDVLAAMSGVPGALREIAICAKTQCGSVKFADDMLALADRLDGGDVYRQARWWPLDGGGRAFGLSREEAATRGELEQRIRRQREIVDAALDGTPYKANGGRLARVAALCDPDTFAALDRAGWPRVAMKLTSRQMRPISEDGRRLDIDDLLSRRDAVTMLREIEYRNPKGQFASAALRSKPHRRR